MMIDFFFEGFHYEKHHFEAENFSMDSRRDIQSDDWFELYSAPALGENSG